MLFLYIKMFETGCIYIYTEKCEFYAKMNFSKNIYWLRLQWLNRLIYNFSFAKVNTEIHIHNWREKMSTHVTFDYSKALSFIGEHEITYLRDAVKVTHHAIHEKLELGTISLGG